MFQPFLILNYLETYFTFLGLDYTFNITSKYLNKCFEIINKNNIEYVIISSPPFSLFYLVKKIKKKFKNIKIILDYREMAGLLELTTQLIFL